MQPKMVNYHKNLWVGMAKIKKLQWIISILIVSDAMKIQLEMIKHQVLWHVLTVIRKVLQYHLHARKWDLIIHFITVMQKPMITNVKSVILIVRQMSIKKVKRQRAGIATMANSLKKR